MKFKYWMILVIVIGVLATVGSDLSFDGWTDIKRQYNEPISNLTTGQVWVMWLSLMLMVQAGNSGNKS